MKVRTPAPRAAGMAAWDDSPRKIHFCKGCGKVSQAQRKPRYHRRLLRGLVADGAGTPDLTGAERAERLGFQVLEVEEERSGTTWRPIPSEPHRMEPYEDWYEPPAAWIACGPFETWTARRDAA